MGHRILNKILYNSNKFRDFLSVNSYTITRFFSPKCSLGRFNILNFYVNIPSVYKPFLKNNVFFEGVTIRTKEYLFRIFIVVVRTIILVPNRKSHFINFIKNFVRNNFQSFRVKKFVYFCKFWMRYGMKVVMDKSSFVLVSIWFGLLKYIGCSRFFPIKILKKSFALTNRKSKTISRFYETTISQKRTVYDLLCIVIKRFSSILFCKKITLGSFSPKFSYSSPRTNLRAIYLSSVGCFKNVLTNWANIHSKIIYLTDSFVKQNPQRLYADYPIRIMI